MSALIELVPVAELCGEFAGDPKDAANLVAKLMADDHVSSVPAHTDLGCALRTALERVGVVDKAGHVNSARAGELVLVCELLATMSESRFNAPVGEQRLLLSSPSLGASVALNESLEAFVLDVIRHADHRLHIGGAFWDATGFEMLDEVLLPALSTRGVQTTIWVNSHSGPSQALLESRARTLRAEGPCDFRWYIGPRPTMLHAKFVIADESLGYLGTANLTSWGLGRHVEAGIELTSQQCRRLVSFLEELVGSGYFASLPLSAA